MRAPDGSLLWHAGPAAGSEYAGAPASIPLAGLTARAAFPPAVAARLALVEPRSRLRSCSSCSRSRAGSA